MTARAQLRLHNLIFLNTILCPGYFFVCVYFDGRGGGTCGKNTQFVIVSDKIKHDDFSTISNTIQEKVINIK